MDKYFKTFYGDVHRRMNPRVSFGNMHIYRFPENIGVGRIDYSYSPFPARAVFRSKEEHRCQVCGGKIKPKTPYYTSRQRGKVHTYHPLDKTWW